MTKKLLVLTALTLMLATSAAVADSTICPLEPTPKGYDVGASGMALITSGRTESVEAKIAAALEDGTVLMVSATLLDGRTVDLGSLSMLLGAGEFSLDSSRNRFSPAFPTSNISGVSVSWSGTPLLEGKCGGGGDKDEPKPRR